jgi:GT2 family glycosyltransferase
MNISSSIVIYKNNPEQINPLITCILDSGIVDKINIIDNSPEKTFGIIDKNNKIEYYFTGSNIGYGAGHNLAISKSMEHGYQYHIVINPDVIFKKGTIEKLFGFMNSNTDVGNVMPKVLYPDGSIQFLCKLLPSPMVWIGRRFNPFFSLIEKRNNKFELRFTGYNKIMDVPYLSGCFMFLRLSALKVTGLFDEHIFMYGEDTDLCRRLNIAGFRTVFFPGAEIKHEFQKGSHKSIRLTFTGIKSSVYYFNKWGWFFDKERTGINRKTLDKLGYIK